MTELLVPMMCAFLFVGFIIMGEFANTVLKSDLTSEKRQALAWIIRDRPNPKEAITQKKRGGFGSTRPGKRTSSFRKGSTDTARAEAEIESLRWWRQI